LQVLINFKTNSKLISLC